MAVVAAPSVHPQHRDDPFSGAVAITPSDTDDLVNVSRGIYCGGAGNLKVDTEDGQTVTFTALAIGVVHHIKVKRVYSTGTTSTAIVALN